MDSEPDAAAQFIARMQQHGRESQRAALVLRLRGEYAKYAYLVATMESDVAANRGTTASFRETRDAIRDAIAYIRSVGGEGV